MNLFILTPIIIIIFLIISSGLIFQYNINTHLINIPTTVVKEGNCIDGYKFHSDRCYKECPIGWTEHNDRFCRQNIITPGVNCDDNYEYKEEDGKCWWVGKDGVCDCYDTRDIVDTADRKSYGFRTLCGNNCCPSCSGIGNACDGKESRIPCQRWKNYYTPLKTCPFGSDIDKDGISCLATCPDGWNKSDACYGCCEKPELPASKN